MLQATSWVNHLIANPDSKYPNQGYSELITQRFGKDLDQILGPVSQRKPYNQVGQAEVDSRLELVDEKLFLINMRGGKQQLLQTFYGLLEHLEATRALWGIDLPLMNITPMSGVGLHPIEILWINYRSQRTLYARHIVQLIFKFDPWSVFNATGRKTKEAVVEKLFINDGQHRTIACMMFGIRYMAVQYCTSDDENVDIDQFCACNVDNLPSEAYDDYRNRKERCAAYIQANRPPVREDKFMWDIAQWANRWDIKICRGGDPMANGARGISHMGDLYKSARMGFDVMDAAAAVLVKIYPNDPMKSANLVGLCELLKQQEPEWMDIDYQGPMASILNPKLADLSEIIEKRFGNLEKGQNSGTYHDQCKQAINNWYKEKYNTLSNPSGIAPEVKVAHATYHVYESYSTKYKLTIPKTVKDETYNVLPSFTEGYKKWM